MVIGLSQPTKKTPTPEEIEQAKTWSIWEKEESQFDWHYDSEETFYVLEGDGVVEIGTERAEITKDQLIFSPAKIAHRLFNESERNFRFLVIKTPTPTTETKIL